MLGLGSSVNSEEGYAKGERYRERWNDHLNAYHEANNPVGHDGYDYMGDFTKDADIDDWTESSSSVTRAFNRMVITASGSNGNASIFFKTVPGVEYTLAFSIISISAGALIAQIGTEVGDGTYYNSGNVTSSGNISEDFTPTGTNACITLIVRTTGEHAVFDDFYLSET